MVVLPGGQSIGPVPPTSPLGRSGDQENLGKPKENLKFSGLGALGAVLGLFWEPGGVKMAQEPPKIGPRACKMEIGRAHV